MKKIILIVSLALALVLFMSRERKYSEMENFKIQATALKLYEKDKSPANDFSKRKSISGLDVTKCEVKF